MLYALVNGSPVEVRKVNFNDLTITNPTDDFLAENGLGYPKIDTPAPSYDAAKEKISSEWSIRSGAIERVWTLTPLDENELVALHNLAIDEHIKGVNEDYEAWKITPLAYSFGEQTMQLKPIWVTEYYSTLMQVGLMSNGANFPATITDATGTNFEMTFQEFQTMFLWLVSKAQAKIKLVNDTLADLNTQKEVANA